MPSSPKRRAAGVSPACWGRVLAAALVALVFATVSVPAGAQPSDESITERRSVAAVVETIGGHRTETAPRPLRAPVRALAGSRLFGRQSTAVFGRRIDGTMTTTYETAAPQSVRTVIDAAVAAWDDALALSPTAPVEISVRWTDLGPRLLGQAGTEGEYRNADRFPTDRWYPAALANQLANLDVNGPDTPEVLVELNSGLGDDWYIGTDGKPGFGQIDLYSVVLHEIAHGLGFLGSAISTKDGTVSVDHESPSIYDDLLMTADGHALIDLDPEVAIAALTSEALRVDVGFGRLMPIHSPARFVNGSSYSHFDESIADNEAGAMMTPALKNGESQRKIDAAVLGVLDQIGWTLDVGLLAPDIGAVDIRSGGLEVTWTEDWTTPGAFAARYQLAVNPLASSGTAPAATTRTVEAARSSSVQLRGLQNGTSYELSITGERAGAPSRAAVGTTFLLPPNPNPVLGLVVDHRARSTGLTWTPPVASGEPVTSYEVNYRDATDDQWTAATVTGTSWTGDLPDGRYWFRVRGLNRVGSGLWTESPLIGLATGPARPMPLDGQLARLYRAYFDRSADAAGIEYWRNIRTQGGSIEAVSDEFARSNEFVATYGPLSDQRFVDRLYRNVLDRSPDSAGYEYWLDLLETGVARGTIVLWFSESAEFVRVTGTAAPQSSVEGSLERLQIALLRRAPTGPELEQLVARRRASSLSDVALGLIDSDEFRSVWDSEDGADLLDLIGTSIGVTPSEIQALSARLNDNEPLAQLVVEMSERPAFIVSTGTMP